MPLMPPVESRQGTANFPGCRRSRREIGRAHARGGEPAEHLERSRLTAIEWRTRRDERRCRQRVNHSTPLKRAGWALCAKRDARVSQCVRASFADAEALKDSVEQ